MSSTPLRDIINHTFRNFLLDYCVETLASLRRREGDRSPREILRTRLSRIASMGRRYIDVHLMIALAVCAMGVCHGSLISPPRARSLRFRGGADGNGGALTILSGRLQLSGCTFLSNRARRGGAVYAVGGVVIVQDSSFSRNPQPLRLCQVLIVIPHTSRPRPH